ncbi:MAG TPA: ZIP family metal transporter [Gemmatimonadales bacterium]|nr:ZIP family metal transporter [Gemmatimonadales bacterium]
MIRSRTFWFALPLALLAVLSLVVVKGGTLSRLARGLPPVEELTVDRTRLTPGHITLDVVNGGPDPVTVAQVMVDEAFWTHTMTPDRTVSRLGRARIDIPYPWVEGEPHHIKLVTATGITFDHEIAVATETPTAGAAYFLTFTLVGLYVGVLPVAIGLLWLPFLKRLDRRWIHFALALTAGLLLFLAGEALHEAFETAERVAGAFQGTGLVLLGALGTWLVLQAFGGTGRGEGGSVDRLRLAFLIALGIGLHNLGEGLAVGAAYAQGAVTLGAFLIVGFMIHNTTEGLGIVAPIAQDNPSLKTLALAGLLAGGPTIVGAWLGGLAYSPVLGTVCLAIGAGAILQVVGVLYKVVAREAGETVWSPLNAMGVTAGLVIMYGTGLLVAQ